MPAREAVLLSGEMHQRFGHFTQGVRGGGLAAAA